MEESEAERDDTDMKFYNDKNRRKIAAVIVLLLIVAMVVPLLTYAL